MRRHFVIVLLAVIGIFIGTNGFTQGDQGLDKSTTGKNAPENKRINAFMVDRIIGSNVINMKGELLGKIADLVLDIDTGRILYVIVESGGFLGIGDKLLPVPWESLAALPSEGLFFLDQSKEQMAKAPAFEKNKLPDIADANWGEGIFKHYGVSGYEPRGAMDYRYRSGYEDDGGYNENFGYPTHHVPGREARHEKLFDPKTIKTITGQVIKVDQVPETGFGMEMQLTVFSDKKEVLPVYLGPAYYIVGSEQDRFFQIGDKVTVTGSQVTGHGEPFMLATTVNRENETLRLRDKDGSPEWIGWKKTAD